MKKDELISVFYSNHQTFLDYFNGLSMDELNYRYADKWTAIEQLEHITLCLKPLTKVLLSKEYIRQNFGSLNRTTWSYNIVIENYLAAIQKGGKAPAQFIPRKSPTIQRGEIIDEFIVSMVSIKQLLERYTEEELDTLVLPHPLLGLLTIRELFYLMSYHVIHHQNQIKRILNLNHD